MFEDFWKAWPSNVRKGGKPQCRAKWDKLKLEMQADQIIKHVEWLKTTEQWKKGDGAFIPAPLVYLNQQSWDGADIPDLVVKPDRDPELTRLEEETKKAVPMPEEVRLRLAQLRGRA